MTEQKLRKAFDDLGIAWIAIEHDPVFTVEESEAIHSSMNGSHTKNLFLKAANGGRFLITTEHSKSVDLKALAQVLTAKKFSFGKPDEMMTLLGITPGAVSPLAAMNDRAGKVRIVIDACLADADLVNVHPLRNTATVALSGANLLRLLAGWGHEPMIVPIPVRS